MTTLEQKAEEYRKIFSNFGTEIAKAVYDDPNYKELLKKLDPNNLAEELLHAALIGEAVRFKEGGLRMILGIMRLQHLEPEDIQTAFESEKIHGFNWENNS